jgi:CHAD domain-containing protein
MAAAAGRAAQARLKPWPGWLAKSAGATAAGIALDHLDSAAKARRRLKRNTDPEALHDFRVALRRLRSVLRAYRPWLDAVPKKLRRRLRAIARATSAGRDAEVCLAWLDDQNGVPDIECDRFRTRLERLRDEAYAHVRADVLAAFADVEPRLRRRLKAIRRDKPAAKTSYAAAAAERLQEHIARVAADLARIESVADVATIHDARIQAKRLRYLLEPLADAELPTARVAVKDLKVFQDETGLLCDGFVRRGLIAEAATVDRDGLAMLERLSEADIEKRFEAVRRRHLARGAPRFIKQAGAIARRLAAIR